MKNIDFYLQYIQEAEASSGTILNMQRSKCDYLRKLYNSSRNDMGATDAKTIKLKSKHDGCKAQLATMTKSIQNKGDAAKVSTNVGQGVGKEANLQKRHQLLSKQAAAQSEVNKAASLAKQEYHNSVSQAAADCSGRSDKSICMKRYKIQGVQAARAHLSRAITNCGGTKSPSKCIRKIHNKMDKYNSKLRKLTT